MFTFQRCSSEWAGYEDVKRPEGKQSFSVNLKTSSSSFPLPLEAGEIRDKLVLEIIA